MLGGEDGGASEHESERRKGIKQDTFEFMCRSNGSRISRGTAGATLAIY
jgi:hypothetical protein